MHKTQPKRTQRGVMPSESAQRSYERYINLAREAASRGDEVAMENFSQHAEHYYRAIGQIKQT